MELHRAGREYLKTILVLEQTKGAVHSLDISKALRVTKPSVSKAMKRLRESGYLTMDGKKQIRLTTAGREAAMEAKRVQNIVEKHSQGAFLLVLSVLRLAASAAGSAPLRTN